jgi:hypothetical protein
MVKRTNPSIKASQKGKSAAVVLEEYYCWKDLQPKPVTMAFLEKTADLLIDWATNNKDALALEGFYEYSGIAPRSYCTFRKRCPKLQEAHDQALVIIGNKREVGAMQKKLDSASVWRRQYQFGETYKEAMIFAAQLAKKEESVSGGAQFTICLPEVRASNEYFEGNKETKNA